MNKEGINIELVTIIEVNDIYKAAIIQDILEEMEITVFLQNKMLAQLYGNVVGGVIVQVPNTDAEKALNVLIEKGFTL